VAADGSAVAGVAGTPGPEWPVAERLGPRRERGLGWDFDRPDILPPSLNVSICRIQNFAHNISISMDKDKNKGVGGWRVSG
jgi:hypothetical protein